MLSKAKDKKFSLGVSIAIATQVAGGLFYINTLISDINTATGNIEQLEQEVKILNGKMHQVEFQLDRLSYKNNFQNMDIEDSIGELEEEIDDLEDEINDLF